MAVKKSELKKFQLSSLEIIIELKKRQPPPKKRVVWTDDEITYLKAFVDDAQLEGVSITTMAKHFEILVAPQFPGKTKSAFQKMANELSRGDRAAKRVDDDDEFVTPPLRIKK